MMVQHPTLSKAKHKITQWRKQAHILGVLFGVLLWAIVATTWPIMLGVYWWCNR